VTVQAALWTSSECLTLRDSLGDPKRSAPRGSTDAPMGALNADASGKAVHNVEVRILRGLLRCLAVSEVARGPHLHSDCNKDTF